MSSWLGGYARDADNARKHRGIDIILRHGAFVPAGVTPPILAIHCDDAAALGRLVGRDPAPAGRRFRDMPYGNIELRGATLLHCAVEFGERSCLDALLDYGADVNAAADVIDGVGGQMPIFHAVNAPGLLPTLQHLIARAGRRLDLSIKATFRGNAGRALRDFDPTSTPMTALEYAERAVRDVDSRYAHSNSSARHGLDLLRVMSSSDG